MKAIVITQYGPPEVLQLKELAKPELQEGEVLVAVHAASVNYGDKALVRGKRFLIRYKRGAASHRLDTHGRMLQQYFCIINHSLLSKRSYYLDWT